MSPSDDFANDTTSSAILQPVVALVLWSMVMWAWLYATRIPAIVGAKVEMDPTMTTADLSARLPPHVRWKADNYNHLMEQPTLFYATVIILGVIGQGDGLNLQLPWAYVLLRIVHSIVQATWNRVVVRFSLFCLATTALLLLAINAARVTL